MPIGEYLSYENFDADTTRVLGVAFEVARAAVKRPIDLTDELIAKRIIELAKTGERNLDVLCETALNVPASTISAPSLPRQ